MNAGAIGYLVKPIDMEKLNIILTKIQNTVSTKYTNPNSEDLHDISRLNTEEKQLLEKVSNNPINHVSPEFSNIDPIFPGIDVNDKWIKIMRILNKLSEKGFLKREERERVILCPSCDSIETFSRYSCPSCNSKKIERLNLIQHLKCGHMGHKKEFIENADYLCPKCLPLTHKPEEYRIIGTIFECIECGSRFNKPNISHYCKSCDEYFDHNTSRYVPIYNYLVDNSIKENFNKNESTLINEDYHFVETNVDKSI
jgi:YesN/AraC family two-component response regulator